VGLLTGGIIGGVAALVACPVMGAKKAGVKGFAAGVGQGAAAAVLIPVGGTVAGLTQVVRGTVQTPGAIWNSTRGKTWSNDSRSWIKYSLPEEMRRLEEVDKEMQIYAEKKRRARAAERKAKTIARRAAKLKAKETTEKKREAKEAEAAVRAAAAAAAGAAAAGVGETSAEGAKEGTQAESAEKKEDKKTKKEGAKEGAQADAAEEKEEKKTKKEKPKEPSKRGKAGAEVEEEEDEDEVVTDTAFYDLLEVRPSAHLPAGIVTGGQSQPSLGLYKIFCHLEAFVHESILLVLPTPTCVAQTIAILLHDCCAVYNTPRPPCVCDTPCTILVITISWKGQSQPLSERAQLCSLATRALRHTYPSARNHRTQNAFSV